MARCGPGLEELARGAGSVHVNNDPTQGISAGERSAPTAVGAQMGSVPNPVVKGGLLEEGIFGLSLEGRADLTGRDGIAAGGPSSSKGTEALR